ncbi:hypothetical protein TNCV_3706491 [Trichonephila clavipes]|nr:hypothetical protein TNCV_3706491 [Trichonephila clavipes]
MDFTCIVPTLTTCEGNNMFRAMFYRHCMGPLIYVEEYLNTQVYLSVLVGLNRSIGRLNLVPSNPKALEDGIHRMWS